jgi:hypothetical protein
MFDQLTQLAKQFGIDAVVKMMLSQMVVEFLVKSVLQ